jgi:hypothetical protein
MPAQTVIKVRRDTAANWVTAQTTAGSTPILSAGEQGYETDTGRSKFGDGTSLWGSLPYSKAIAAADYETTAGSASPKVLTKDSPRNQIFTGTTNQTIWLPDATTLQLGDRFEITSAGTLSLTVRLSGGGSIVVSSTIFPSGYKYVLTCVSNTSNVTGSWLPTFEGASGVSGLSGNIVVSNSPTLTTPTLTLSTTASTTAGRLSVTGDNLRLGNGSTTLTFSANPMTTAGDLIVGGASGAPARIAIGTVGQVLTSNGTTATWSAPTGGGGESISSFLLMGA